MTAKRVFVTTALCLAPLAASAASLPIDGKYGNKDGCAYAKTEESTGSENFFLLTPETVTTATASCNVKTVGAIKGNAMSVVFSCQAEGEESGTDSPATIIRTSKNAYKIVFDDGTVWGPLRRCR